MEEISYNEMLLGFFTKDGGITHSTWSKFIDKQPFIERIEKERRGINPFTNEEVVFSPTVQHQIFEGSEILGLLVWEGAEAVGLAGNSERLRPYIESISNGFGATYVQAKKLTRLGI